jgi:hypothetical protein
VVATDINPPIIDPPSADSAERYAVFMRLAQTVGSSGA